MNKATVCNSASEQPFESFVEDTTTSVCLPEGSDYQLFFQVREPGLITIEADGEELASQPVEPSDHLIDLKKILTAPQPARSLFLNLTGTRRTTPRKAREFKVTIKRGENASALVAATLDFRLLSPAEYKLAYAKHLGDSPSSARPVFPHQFIVDWQPATGKHCWNCRESLDDKATQCPRCGSDQDHEEPQA